jgi:hypothetical protein
MVHHHHESEEKYFFAALAESLGKDKVDQCLDEHQTFYDGVEAYDAYLASLEGKENEFSGARLVEIVDSFKDALHTHLTNEIITILSWESLNAMETIQECWDAAVEGGKTDMELKSVVSLVPFGLVNNDITFEGGIHGNFPPAPKALKLLVSYGFTAWNWSWWKFAACGKDGLPRELYARAEE